MQGASPLASPGLNCLRHLQTLPYRYPAKGSLWLGAKTTEMLSYWQCRQPRRGGTGGEELRRLRWSSPPGQGEPVPQGFSHLSAHHSGRANKCRTGFSHLSAHHSGRANKCRTGFSPLRTPQRQGQPVPPEAKAHTTTIFFLPPAIAAQGKPRRRRAERREQTEQYAGEH